MKTLVSNDEVLITLSQINASLRRSYNKIADLNICTRENFDALIEIVTDLQYSEDLTQLLIDSFKEVKSI